MLSLCVLCMVLSNFYVVSSDYPFFFRVIIVPLVALSAGSARDLPVLLLNVRKVNM
jgi:hypothetical protein